VIVVDTNIIAYLYLPCAYTPLAERLLAHDADWVAPLLWRSEMRNVLALYLRRQQLSFDQALTIQGEAESLLAEGEYEPDSLQVLRLVQTSDCSAYDCEFVALARHLGVRLVTQDKKVLAAFPEIAVSLSNLFPE
jgi:predicted nucleic acid-binding protein